MEFEWTPEIEKEIGWSKEDFIAHLGLDEPLELPMPPWGAPEYADRNLYLHGMIDLADLCRTHRGLITSVYVSEESLGNSKEDLLVFLAMLRILLNGTYHLYLKGKRFVDMQSAIAALLPHDTLKEEHVRDYDLYVSDSANKNVNGRGFDLKIIAPGNRGDLVSNVEDLMIVNASYCTNFRFIILDSRPGGVALPCHDGLNKLAKERGVQEHAFFSAYINTPWEVM